MTIYTIFEIATGEACRINENESCCHKACRRLCSTFGSARSFFFSLALKCLRRLVLRPSIQLR